jgi:hypothetical protein
MATITDIVEIKKLVSAKLKKAFPKYGFVLKTDRGSTDTLDINWYKADFYPFLENGKFSMQINNYYINDSKVTQKAKDVLNKIKDITDEYNEDNSTYGHRSVKFYLHLYVGRFAKPFEVNAPSTKSTAITTASTSSTSDASTFDKGQLLRSEAGWKAYVKTLPDGRIVYNAFKDKETAANKTDWNVIKGEVYVESGFKWSKFGFSRWGSLTPNDENLLLDYLFKVLSKYYQSANVPTQHTQQDSNNDNGTPQFVYGENFGVPKNDGQEIIVALESRGFNIIEGKNQITISKLGYTPISVYDNGGEFSLNNALNNFHLRSIAYSKTSSIETPQILAILIEDIYFDEIIFIDNTQNNDAEKKQIEEAITALEYLANLGDQDAISAITALRYLL